MALPANVQYVSGTFHLRGFWHICVSKLSCYIDSTENGFHARYIVSCMETVFCVPFSLETMQDTLYLAWKPFSVESMAYSKANVHKVPSTFDLQCCSIQFAVIPCTFQTSVYNAEIFARTANRREFGIQC